MEKKFDTHRLTPQVIATLVAVVLLTAGTVGLSAIWLVQKNLDLQTWSQVEQGQRAAISIYSAQYRKILNLAILTAQRPTLRELMVEDDIAALTDYLHNLRNGAGLTRIIVCDPQDQIIATTDESIPETICQKWRTGNYQYNPNIPQACLTAHQPVEDETGILGEVFVCIQLDEAFVQQISDETGLEHTLWIEDTPVATSFTAGIAELENTKHNIVFHEGRKSHHTFYVNGVPYYSAHLPLEEAGLSAEVALDVMEIQNMRAQLVRTIIISILAIALIASALGILLFHYISSSSSHNNIPL
jgi:hypothetical protein